MSWPHPLVNYRRKPVSLGSCSSVSGPVLSLPPCLFLLPAFIPYLSSLSFIANYTSLTLLSSHHRLSGTLPLSFCVFSKHHCRLWWWI